MLCSYLVLVLVGFNCVILRSVSHGEVRCGFGNSWLFKRCRASSFDFAKETEGHRCFSIFQCYNPSPEAVTGVFISIFRHPPLPRKHEQPYKRLQRGFHSRNVLCTPFKTLEWLGVCPRLPTPLSHAWQRVNVKVIVAATALDGAKC